MKYPWKWEYIKEGGFNRLKVPNGWVIYMKEPGDKEISTALCFVPDANHEWELEDV